MTVLRGNYKSMPHGDSTNLVVKNQDKVSRKTKNGLCFRCEHRATFLEEGFAPRAECKDVERVKSICYSYTPVRPCWLKYPDYEGEYGELNKSRSPAGGLSGARMEFDSVAELDRLERSEYDQKGGVKYLTLWV